MRHVLFALLVAAPTALVTWVLTRGASCPRPEVVGLQLGGSGAAGGAATGSSGPAGASSPAPAASPARTAPAPASASLATGPRRILAAALVSPLGPAHTTGPVGFYDAKGLFDYVDGAAPLYIDRGFVLLAGAELALAAGGELTCDVYDMGGSDGAKSVYAAERTGQQKPLAVGDEGRTSSLALSFRKGRYYVRLTAFDRGSEAALPEVARALAARLP